MLPVICVLVILAVAYAHMVEGLFTACCMFVNVFLACVVAFNFWEPIAAALEPQLLGTFLSGYEDALCMVALFWLALVLLRMATNQLATTEIDFHPMAQRIGGAIFGLMTGYIVSGFLVCVLQTLPWHVNFMSFEPGHESDKALRKLMPPDRALLALMHRAGLCAFNGGPETFDNEGNFELRYTRYRRYDEKHPLPYYGEFDRDLFQTEASQLPPMPALPALPGSPSTSAPADPLKLK